jgi:hypothetical protein
MTPEEAIKRLKAILEKGNLTPEEAHDMELALVIFGDMIYKLSQVKK